jgi:isoquinoline 1-oxidoreductase beta subunit
VNALNAGTVGKCSGVERRDFLKISVAASGGLLIGFQFPGMSRLASAQASASNFMPNAFVRIGTDERITVIVNHSEMGQGVYTSLPMLLADELDADWTKVGYESAPADYRRKLERMVGTGSIPASWRGGARHAGSRGSAAVECGPSQLPH